MVTTTFFFIFFIKFLNEKFIKKYIFFWKTCLRISFKKKKLRHSSFYNCITKNINIFSIHIWVYLYTYCIISIYSHYSQIEANSQIETWCECGRKEISSLFLLTRREKYVCNWCLPDYWSYISIRGETQEFFRFNEKE